MKKILTAIVLILSLLLSSCDFVDRIFKDSDSSSENTDGGSTNTNNNVNNNCPGKPDGSDEGESGDGDGSSGGNTDGGGSDSGNTGGNTDGGGSGGGSTEGKPHTDTDDNGICDVCYASVITELSFLVINDFHGKMSDSDTQPGADELSLYLKTLKEANPNSVLLSSGDMWQGGAESNLSRGLIVTEWMNELGFEAMTLGNHEYDWGEEYIRSNADAAEFPILAINVYDRNTSQRAEYCEPSVMIERGGVKIGIIGAIGDCYSSISADKCEDVYFKTGYSLTSLVKEESQRLRAAGADYIVYSLHDGHGSSSSASSISDKDLSGYYDISLSSGGYVDVVFEGHSHQSYALKDSWGVYHLQGGGDNSGFIKFSVNVNFVTGTDSGEYGSVVSKSLYQGFNDDPFIDELFEKYKDVIAKAYELLGYNPSYIDDSVIEQKVAELYYLFGEEVWGDEYDIVLGGGFLRTRSPYNLYSGEITYADIMMVLPFDNPIVLCSISGKNLKSKFFNSTNSDYYVYYDEYGKGIKDSIDDNATYYVIVDTYTAYYKPNGLTIIEKYDDETFARDLLAEYIKAGKMW